MLQEFLVLSWISDLSSHMCTHELPPAYISRERCIGSLCTAISRLAQVERRCERLVVAPALGLGLGHTFRGITKLQEFLLISCISESKLLEFLVISWISESELQEFSLG